MFAYIIRRLLISIVVLFFATILVFLLVTSSGDPLALAEEQPPHPPRRRSWPGRTCSTSTTRCGSGTGSGSPVPSTATWARRISGQDVASEMMSHLFVTLRMVDHRHRHRHLRGHLRGRRRRGAAEQGHRPRHHRDQLRAAGDARSSCSGLALKEFVAIPINQHVGTIIFYTDGEQSPTLSGSFFSRLPDYAAHTALPGLTLVLISYASWAIYQRSSMIETLDADHVRLARAKGLSPRRVLVRHVLRNALIPVTTVIALDFAAVLGGAIITEIVFGWQGLGQWYLDGRHQPRRERHAGLPADHGHLRHPVQPGRRHPLRRTRPEDPLCLSR